jgi:hypothetical protein
MSICLNFLHLPIFATVSSEYQLHGSISVHLHLSGALPVSPSSRFPAFLQLPRSLLVPIGANHLQLLQAAYSCWFLEYENAGHLELQVTC